MTTLLCPAKINLYLAILEKDENGYHKLDTIFARLRESVVEPDLIHIEPANRLSFHCETLPAEGNTVLKTLHLLEAKTKRNFTYKITLEKHIPICAGLGGGASDAASLLLFLNQTENLGLSQNELMELGANVGKDVPFFISGYEVARGTRYGDEITALPPLPKVIHIKIEEPFIPASTAEAFAKWDKNLHKKAPSIEPLLEALHSQNAEAILRNLHNDFEPLTHASTPSMQVQLLAGSGGAHAVLHVVGN